MSSFWENIRQKNKRTLCIL